MNTINLITAVQTGDIDAVRRALDAGANCDERDEHGWTALNWAAGKGYTEIVRLLLEKGADIALSGRDGRTAYAIARAAGRTEAAEILRLAEQSRGLWKDPRVERPYCRAYKLGDLLEFNAFHEIACDQSSRPNDTIVYLHQDFTVTASMWHGENVIVRSVTPAWREFCESRLAFEIPADVI